MKKISLIILSFLLVGSFFFGQVFGQVEEAKGFDWDQWKAERAEKAAQRAADKKARAVQRAADKKVRAVQREADRKARAARLAARRAQLEVEKKARADKLAADRKAEPTETVRQRHDRQIAEKVGKTAHKEVLKTIKEAETNLGKTAKGYINSKIGYPYKLSEGCQGSISYCGGGGSKFAMDAGYVNAMCGGKAEYCIRGDTTDVKRSFDGSCSWKCVDTDRICYWEKCPNKTMLLYAVVLTSTTYCISGGNLPVGSNTPTESSPACGSASEPDNNNFSDLTASNDQLCLPNPGATVSEFVPTGQGWKWKCNYSNKTTGLCIANKIIQPSCTISPNPIRVCPDQKSTISITSLVPADGTLSWAGNGSASPDKKSYEMGAGTATLTVTKNSKTGDCSASVQAKPAGCTVSLSGADNLTVGKTATVSIEPSCLKKPYSYSLSPSDNWSYPNGSSDINDGTATIKVEKAGTLNFDATVSGNGQTVNCSSQASAFTSGSEWWERKPE